jgi:hypothetical protein
MPDEKQPRHDMDERVSLPLDPETALRALLEVDPEDEPAPPPKPKGNPKPA